MNPTSRMPAMLERAVEPYSDHSQVAGPIPANESQPERAWSIA